ncbi:hypothetical protein [Acidipila rosea]|uniref:Uncharacterized protein n=1 Tax=Acidipila rosea TaxID=768535 RepID=A0A4R1L0S7_9BACT|nr:hypothetical protein [Acidipila rosea]TCK71518.1 hypothetical protein C7378_2797 [Acidipila rosea]
MQPDTFGRKVGIGLRVAGRLLRSRAGDAAVAARRDAPVYLERGRAVAKGSRKLGSSLWQPVAHAGSVLWLEVTGLFFALFALFFLQNLYRLRDAWRTGAEHQHFVLYVIFAVLFAYFSASSFYRARRRKRRRQAEGR